MYSHFRQFIAALVLLVAASPCAAVESTFARRAIAEFGSVRELAVFLPDAPSERNMLADAADGRWDKFDLLSATLIAQVESRKERARYAAKLERQATLARQFVASRPEKPAAESLFTYLHEEILTGSFAADCHSIARALSSGNYNCLSGTVLFVGLANRCNVNVQAVLAPSHVFASARLDGQQQDIETTVPSWFRESLTIRKDRLAAALGDNVNSHRRPLTSVGLLAVVYYNRGVEAFNKRDFATAAADNLVALRLDNENTAASDNFLAAINNWALQSAKRGDADLATQLLTRARRLAPTRSDLQATERFAAQRAAVTEKEQVPAGPVSSQP